MVLHHKMSQTVKIKVNRYTNIYLFMNLLKINQFIFIFCWATVISHQMYNSLKNPPKITEKVVLKTATKDTGFEGHYVP